MKNILVHIHDDDSLESRLQVALDLVRQHEGHLTCVQNLPIQDYALSEPISGFSAVGTIFEEMQKIADRLREGLEARLQNEGISWSWIESVSDTNSALLSASALADLLVVSQYPGAKDALRRPLPIPRDIALRVSCPMLVVPAEIHSMPCEGPVVVAWNGSIEAAHILRQSLPFLAKASRVEIVAVGEDNGTLSQQAASQYLSRHGIDSMLHQLPVQNGSVSKTLHQKATEMNACALVIGAYGHSRFREALMGGVTEDLLTGSRIPLILGH